MHYVYTPPTTTTNPYELEQPLVDSRQPENSDISEIKQMLNWLMMFSDKLDKAVSSYSRSNSSLEFDGDRFTFNREEETMRFPYTQNSFEDSGYTESGEPRYFLQDNTSTYSPYNRSEERWPSTLDNNSYSKSHIPDSETSNIPGEFPKEKVRFDSTNMDAYTLIMMLQEDRVGLLESQIGEQSKRMQDINSQIKSLGDTIGKVNQASSGLKEGKDKTNIDDSLRQELRDLGVDVPDGEVSKDQLNSFAETLKSKRDGLNNDSQMEMIRLQGLINKQQQAYQLITNIQKKEHDMIMSTINKIN